MSFIAYRARDDRLDIVDVSPESVGTVESLTLTASGINIAIQATATSPDGKHVLIGLNDGTNRIGIVDVSGNVPSNFRLLSGSDSNTITGLAFSDDGLTLVASHFVSGGLSGGISFYSFAGGEITRTGTLSPSNNINIVAISPDGTRAAGHDSSNNRTFLFDVEGLSEITNKFGTSADGLVMIDANTVITLGRGSLQSKLWDVSSGSFSESQQFDKAQKGSFKNGLLLTDTGLFSWDGASLTSVSATLREYNDVIRFNASLFSISNNTVYALDESAAETDSIEPGVPGLANLSGFEDSAPSGPTTSEELFQASYALASAAEPKPTALVSATAVQRSIDTDVFNLSLRPKLHQLEVIFDVGELDQLGTYNPATSRPRHYLVTADEPGLRQGKIMLLKSYRIRTWDPAEPVTCTFWG